RERQRPLLPVLHLRGHGARGGRGRHLRGSGVRLRPGLWSARGVLQHRPSQRRHRDSSVFRPRAEVLVSDRGAESGRLESARPGLHGYEVSVEEDQEVGFTLLTVTRQRRRRGRQREAALPDHGGERDGFLRRGA
ncbi:hypothetical protein KUCAC02_034333, partial [Chaenocephalus aceratus]